MKRSAIAVIALLLALAALAWLGWHRFMPTQPPTASTAGNGVVQDDSGKTVRYWYDPMVPAQKFDKPGKSPFMDMQLVPKYADEGAADVEGGNAVAISAQTMQNLGIRVATVEIIDFDDDFTGVGRITPDERDIYTVQTRIPGFVERLLVRAVGDPVKKGQKLAEVYAPELLAAQQEYLALSKLEQLPDADSLQQAARRRLELLGMSPREITAIGKTGVASPRFGIYAPASGVVSELSLREGAQLLAGDSLMQISDLSTVWLMAEVPERDIARLKPGAVAEVSLRSLPGELLHGRVNYIYPTLDEMSRTVQVRIELPNRDGLLRPGMYADVTFSGQRHQALAVPSESVIVTGTRKVVIVKDEHGFRPAEVVTGRQEKGYTEIIDGLAAGEQVVASGQFLIDSEASLSGALTRLRQADPSAMQTMPDASNPHENMQHGEPMMPAQMDGQSMQQGTSMPPAGAMSPDHAPHERAMPPDGAMR